MSEIVEFTPSAPLEDLVIQMHDWKLLHARLLRTSSFCCRISLWN